MFGDKIGMDKVKDMPYRAAYFASDFDGCDEDSLFRDMLNSIFVLYWTFSFNEELGHNIIRSSLLNQLFHLAYSYDN